MEGAAIAVLICVYCGVCKILHTRKPSLKKTIKFYDNVREFRREHGKHDDSYINVKDLEKD